MDDYPSPTRNPLKGVDGKSDNKDSGKIGTGDVKHHAHSANEKAEPKSILAQLDSIFGILEIVALVLWMLSELFHERNKFNFYCLFLWLAMVCFLAGAAHIAHKTLNRSILVWSIHIGLCLFLGIVVYEYTRPPLANSIGLKTVEAPKDTNNHSAHFTTDLDDKIRRAFLVFQLSGTNEFENLCPLNGSLELGTSAATEWKILGFKFSNTERRYHSKGNTKRYVSYETHLEMEGSSNSMTQTLVFTDKSQVSVISVPIPLWSVKETPFKTIRDFNNSDLVVGASGNLVSKLKYIEFVVNGWVLFHKDIQPSYWRGGKNQYTLLAFQGDKAHHPVAAFPLTVHRETLPFYANLSGPLEFFETANLFTVKAIDSKIWEP